MNKWRTEQVVWADEDREWVPAEVAEKMRSELQKIVDAADGDGWAQLDPALADAREALDACNRRSF